MEITVNINAAAIVEAVNKLANAIGRIGTGTVLEAIPEGNTRYEVIEPTVHQDTLTADAQPEQQSAPDVMPSVANASQNAPAAMTDNQPPVQQNAPVVDEAYRSRVCNAAARIIEQGKMPDVLNILHSMNVQAVTQLTAVQLPAFAEAITALGAVI